MMSIHAQIKPEALANLATQKRNSTLSSIIIALLLCTLIAVILYVISITIDAKNDKELHTWQSNDNSTKKITEPTTNNEVQRKPAAPTNSMSRLLNANTLSPISVPIPEIIVTEPSLDFGNNDDFGNGDFGSGINDGSPSYQIPSTLNKRCSQPDRLNRLTKEGAKASYDHQVVAALRWLNKTQSKDGSWQAQSKPVAMTGLALLSYLGHCETPSSPEFGEAVQKAIIYLVNVSNKNGGKLATNTTDKHWCYEHAIATYALAESYTLCKAFKLTIPGLEETVLAAGNHIISNQHSSGGWDYAYDTSGSRGGDTSIVCWHLQALKACKLTKIEFNGLDKCAQAALNYLEGAKNGKGTIGYSTTGKNLAHGPTMTPAATLCFQQWAKGNRTFTRNAIKWISDTHKFDYKKEANLYMHYYSSQAMINAQGKAWAEYNSKVITNLAENQEADGSWHLPGSPIHGMTSKHYATCLSILMMEVYYRFLPSS